MPFFSRLASFGALDRFDNGAGLFSTPLEYHDFFRVIRDLNTYLSTAQITIEGHPLVHVDPFATQLLTRLAIDLLLRISAASYGGVLPVDASEWNLFRENAFNELGLVPPPLFHFLRGFCGHLPFELALPVLEYRRWMDELATMANDTREWLTTAQRRTRMLGSRSGWNWEGPEMITGADVQMSPRHSLTWPVDDQGHPDFVGFVVVRPLPGHSTEPQPQRSTAPGALIPHPIYSSNAANALVPSDPAQTRISTSTALIPHPIYGPGAQNALVRYHPMDETPHTPPNSPNSPRTPPPAYSDDEDDDFRSGTDSGTEYGTCYEVEVEELSDSDETDSESDSEYVWIRRGDAPDFPIHIDSDSEDPEEE
ncbi:hypothetical protein GY45DRAFT_1439598 [Cubamyces sp. BRFM 1775]|nr:hypothetical protein GY45DRAFT_1439598 [Cubamyces sp. BRFM 1775]